MVMPSIIDPFFKSLYTKIAEEIDNRSTSLLSGGALIHGGIGIDAIATAVKYQAAISYIEALQFVLEVGQDLDKERYGKRSSNDGED